MLKPNVKDFGQTSFYRFVPGTLSEFKFLRPLKDLIDTQDVEVYSSLPNKTDIDRKAMDGIYTLKANINGVVTGIIYHDFRVYGGSYGIANGHRLKDFLGVLQEKSIPLVFMVNSLGARIMEGRKIFAEVFGLIPAFKDYCQNNLMITVATGRCLGLGALLYDLGDYKIAMEKEGKLNLTGPEVIKMFFGSGVEFDSISHVERRQEKNGQVHFIAQKREQIYQEIRNVLGLKRTIPFQKVENYQEDRQVRELTAQQQKAKEKYDYTLNTICPHEEHRHEIFSQYKGSVHLFLVKTSKGPMGIFLNPVGKPNMIDVPTLKKYQMGLQFFRKLNLPIISFLDTPGADPRPESNDQNIISELNKTAIAIIDYPHPKQGIVLGRCFGGASVLMFPTIFGGEKAFIVKDGNVGIMHNNIIRTLLSSSKSFLAEWEENVQNESEQMTEFQEMGELNRLIDLEEVPSIIEDFLGPCYLKAQDKDSYSQLFSESLIKEMQMH